MRFHTDSVLNVKELADIRIRIIDVSEGQSAVTAFRNTGRIFTVSQFSLKAEVTVFSDFSRWVNEADVVGASRNTVFAAHTSVRIHRDDIRDFISMCSLCRTNTNARCIQTLLARNADVNSFTITRFNLSAVWTGCSGNSRILSFKDHTMNTRRQFINFATRFYTFTASNALVLVEHQNIMRIGSCGFLCRAGCRLSFRYQPQQPFEIYLRAFEVFLILENNRQA